MEIQRPPVRSRDRKYLVRPCPFSRSSSSVSVRRVQCGLCFQPVPSPPTTRSSVQCQCRCQCQCQCRPRVTSSSSSSSSSSSPFAVQTPPSSTSSRALCHSLTLRSSKGPDRRGHRYSTPKTYNLVPCPSSTSPKKTTNCRGGGAWCDMSTTVRTTATSVSSRRVCLHRPGCPSDGLAWLAGDEDDNQCHGHGAVSYHGSTMQTQTQSQTPMQMQMREANNRLIIINHSLVPATLDIPSRSRRLWLLAPRLRPARPIPSCLLAQPFPFALVHLRRLYY